MSPNGPSGAVPAQLSLFAIYNPKLGTTDETLCNQIVFYHSAPKNSRSPVGKERHGNEADHQAKRENGNEKLRQIGLAQGMVSFAKNFSNGEPVDHVLTEKSQVVLHELEKDWWILAKIDLTRLPPTPSASTAAQSNPTSPLREYSSREVAPPYLIRQQLVKAHSIFLLHHAPSLNDLYSRLAREAFCTIIERFWTRFIRNWDVLLNGNPVIDILNGIKLAGGGELGFGVGEEEWGSGEREVLEDFVSRTEGLTDVVVSRFGDARPAKGDNDWTEKSDGQARHRHSWVGCDACASPHDGVVFSGVGALSRFSLMQVSRWMEWIHRYGEDAYGVREDPTLARQRKRRSAPERRTRQRGRSEPKGREPSRVSSASARQLSPGIPPPLVSATNHRQSNSTKSNPAESNNATVHTSPSQSNPGPPAPGSDAFMKILTLGYGSAWGNPSKGQSPRPEAPQPRRGGNAGQESRDGNHRAQDVQSEENFVKGVGILPQDESPGYFILGLRDDPEIDDSDDEDEIEQGQERRKLERNKILLRTLHVSMCAHNTAVNDSATANGCKTLRVAVYLYQPFMFTFLLEPETPLLSSTSFYRSIHHQLGPLQKPLLSSTSRDRIHDRLLHNNVYDSSAENKFPSQHEQIYDVVFDSTNQTLHTSLPNIPEPGAHLQKVRGPQGTSQQPAPWSRLDALNVHAQLVNTYIETRDRASEIERTCKTNRGWWVLWMRLRDRQPPDSSKATAANNNQNPSLSSLQPSPSHATKEVFLVRKASDQAAPSHKQRGTSGSGFFSSLAGLSSSNSAAGSAGRAPRAAAAQIDEGVGLDARWYVDALLSLGR